LRTTRGEVQIQARIGDRLYVHWLMTDGSTRREHRLPVWMNARQLAAEIKSPSESEEVKSA
jgi:hypothetical protein